MQPRHHHLIRLFALAATVGSLTYMAQRSNARADLTAEGLSQITSGTRKLIRSIGTTVPSTEDGGEAVEIPPVVVTAYVSKEVPRPYVPVRSRLLNILREMEASGGPGLSVRIVEPETFSEDAQEAIENYGIAPRPLVSTEGDRVDTLPVFLGVAFTSGPREEVVPFFDRGLSVEYEIVRALEVVTQPEKKVVGIIRDDTKIMGDFDLQSRRRIPRWRVVDELEKQYEVRSLNPGSAIPEDVDVLFVPQVSSLNQASVDAVQSYLLAGRPALLVADPLPFFNPKLAPSQPMLPPPSQGMMGGGQPPEEKGNYRALLATIGVDWPAEHVSFDLENPEAQLADAPRSIVVFGERDGKNTFTGGDESVDGLAQIITLFGGELRPFPAVSTTFEPILVTGEKGGWDPFEQFVDDSNFLFGLQFRGVPPTPTRMAAQDGVKELVVGARISGGGGGGDTGSNANINAIVLADLDMFADSFFQFHERGGDLDGDGLIDMRFDNVTFLLNTIDSLLGDDRFIELRKRQPVFRRLSKVDDMTKKANEERQDKLTAANDAAKAQIEVAQASLDESVAAISQRADLDETTKQIMIRSAQEAENRKLQAKTEQIERDKSQEIDRVEAEHARAVDEVRDRIRVAAILWPPVPALFMGLLLFLRKRRRESSTIPESRKRKDA
ncbi:probable permease of ABC transporter [Plesiocystis pacifica SIR-1]|uniref:Probable permease of ABC transporter n=1 Tax=Plesiocystis pacifica SIR-1 TaxID=391625 RepID=A6G060_9BACT|nr:GldG family protein [Plesiocystis pacifica]EDM80757.1 probable permease of ABC transporter [Plesiocystis pacifica SIR-1]